LIWGGRYGASEDAVRRRDLTGMARAFRSQAILNVCLILMAATTSNIRFCLLACSRSILMTGRLFFWPVVPSGQPDASISFHQMQRPMFVPLTVMYSSKMTRRGHAFIHSSIHSSMTHQLRHSLSLRSPKPMMNVFVELSGAACIGAAPPSHRMSEVHAKDASWLRGYGV
jgi:hypothetical protein